MAELKKEDKKHVSIVICGHVDAGKSTTTGRLIFELGGIDEREMEKLREEAEKMKKGSFAFAFYMDRHKDERARGVTIACTTKEFYTAKYHYTIIDAPGHRDFIKNMISGASQADIALLMVPADGNFTTSIQKGNHKAGVVQGQSRQHARLINLIGVKQIAVGVNKMDTDKAGYSKERYVEIRDEVVDFLSKVGYGGKGKAAQKKASIISTIPIIPMSGFQGDNLLTPSKNMPWWEGVTCKNMLNEDVKMTTLLNVLNDFVCLPERDLAKKLRMPVSGVYKIKGAGDVITGRVEQGSVCPGADVHFYPTHSKARACQGKIFSVEMHHTNVKLAGPGDNVGLNVKGLEKTYLPKTGDVMTLSTEPLMPAQSFVCQVQILSIPGDAKVGYSPIGFVRTGRSACKITKINWRLGKKTGGKKVTDSDFVCANEAAEVVMEPQGPLCVEKFSDCEGLGRIAFLEGNGLVMMGRITDVTFKSWA